MIDVLVTRTIMGSKFANNAFLGFDLMIKCQPPNQYYCKFRSHEKGEFLSHDRNLDLMKKSSFDLMIIISIS
jgi:hypothetical protein